MILYRKFLSKLNNPLINFKRLGFWGFGVLGFWGHLYALRVRIGKRYDCKVSNIYVGKHTLPWGKQIRYLGINVLAGKNLHYDFHLTKAKYFGALNSLLGKIGTSSNIQVALSLTAAKCFPILTYGLEAITISKSQLSNMCFVYNAIFVKLFSTFDKLIIEQCQYHTGVLPFH